MERDGQPAIQGGRNYVELKLLQRVVGRRLTSASRIVHEFAGQVDGDCGDLELTFDDGTIILLRGSGDGERLVMDGRAWVDPFEPPLSKENEAFVRQSGKAVRRDAQLIGAALPIGEVFENYRLVGNQFGTPAGVVMVFAGATVRFVVHCDESYVMTSDDPRFRDWGFQDG